MSPSPDATPPEATAPTVRDVTAAALDLGNPFAAPSTLPYGLPPFDLVRDEHLAPALAAGLAEQRAEWEQVATAAGEPTFAGTVLALERSGRLLQRVAAVVDALASAHATPGVRAVDAEFAAPRAEHSDALFLDARVWAQVDDLHGRRASLGLEADELRLLERYHRDFVRAGAALPEESKQRLREINTELSTLAQRFDTQVTDASNAAALHLTEEAETAGLSPDAVAAARAAAAEQGLDGWLLTLVLPTPQPALASLADRDVRRRLHEAAVGRGLGGDTDTRPLLVRAAALRAERAGLFGFGSHADYVLDDQTAGTVEAVDRVLSGMVPVAAANARAEAAELEAAPARRRPRRAAAALGPRVLRRAGPHPAVLGGRGRPAALPGAGARPARRGPRRRHPPLRHHVHRAGGPARLPPGRAGVRGARRGRQRSRPLRRATGSPGPPSAAARG